MSSLTIFEPEASSDMERLRGLSVQPEALVAFSRAGAWAAALAVAGAKKILCLERDAQANKRAAESWGLNSFGATAFEVDATDAFSRLDKLKGKRRFQSVVLEAPALSKSAHGRFSAARQLPSLVERALALAEPGALAIVSLRRDVMSFPTFLGCVNAGAAEAGFKLETAAVHKAPADFPPLDAFPEALGRYWQAWKLSAV